MVQRARVVSGAGSPSVLRRLNLDHVLRVIRHDGPMSRSAVVAASGLSKPTVNEVVEALLTGGLIIESIANGESGPRRPGPRARLLQFNSRRSFVVGVDIGGAMSRALLADLDGEVLARVRRRTPGDAADNVLAGVRQVVQEAIAQAGVSREAVAVIVVGTPGVVDPESGTVRFVPQFPDWHGQPLQELLTQSLSAPVLVRSEAHLAVAGEHWRGAAAGAKSAVYVQMGVGVGMGVMIDGVVYRGAAGAAGEIGYLPISGSPAPQSPQGFGPLESAVGAAAFTRLAREAIENGKGAGILAVATDEEPGPEAVIQAAAAGDRTAGAIVEAILTTLEKGLISITAVLNPEIVVLGGGLAPSLEPHLPRLQKALGSAVPVPPTLVITALADNATALGALRLGVDHVETQVFNSLASP